MLNSSLAGDSGKVSVRRSAFSHTCALLGQYVKEKKAFGDLSFDMASKIDCRGSNNAIRPTTMNLFPVNERAEEVPASVNGKFVSTFPQHVSSTAIKPNSSEIYSAPMTIFYAGHVIVLNDLTAHKAKEIMDLAGLGISENSNTTTNVVAPNSMLDSTPLVPLTLSHQMQQHTQKLIPTIINDLPLTRRNSLHRFMGRRKERIASNAPYNMNKPGDGISKLKPNESSSWLGLAASGSELH